MKKELEEVLKKAGWYEGRNIDIEEDIREMECEGLVFNEKAKEFLREYGNLKITVESEFLNERNKHMIEIPMVVYGTDKYWNTHPDMMLNLQSSIDRAYRTDNIIYFMEDVMGIKTTSYVPGKSIINDDYIGEDRYYGGVKYVKW